MWENSVLLEQQPEARTTSSLGESVQKHSVGINDGTSPFTQLHSFRDSAGCSEYITNTEWELRHLTDMLHL